MVRAIPAALVHTMEPASDALSMEERCCRLPRRTVEAIDKQLGLCGFVATRQKAFVETIQRASDTLSL